MGDLPGRSLSSTSTSHEHEKEAVDGGASVWARLVREIDQGPTEVRHTRFGRLLEGVVGHDAFEGAGGPAEAWGLEVRALFSSRSFL